MMTLEQLKQYLIEEADYSPEEVENMDPWDLVNAWLTYEGIINYTEDIIDVVFAAYRSLYNIDTTLVKPR